MNVVVIVGLSSPSDGLSICYYFLKGRKVAPPSFFVFDLSYKTIKMSGNSRAEVCIYYLIGL